MKVFILLWFLSLAYGRPQDDISDVQSKHECRVIEKSSGESKPCVGAFVYEDQTFYGCTTVGSENGEAWCSTKIDSLTDEHITEGDFFGYCEDTKCISAEKGQKEQNNLMALQQASFVNFSEDELEETKSKCNCQAWNVCEWSKNAVNSIASLPSNHATRKDFESFFKELICEGKTRKVYCCNDKDAPTVAQMKILKPDNSVRSPLANLLGPPGRDSGKWKPDGFKGECGLRTVISNIVGGRITKVGDFPYMALLGYDGFYGCGGSVINKYYVLTAAHCMVDGWGDPQYPTEVELGEHDIEADPDCRNCPKRITMRITDPEKQITVHKDFDSSGQNDIALIRFNEPIPLFSDDPSKSSIAPLCLPWGKDNPVRDLLDSDQALITGWGRTQNKTLDEQHDRVYSTKLLKVKASVANEKCNEVIKENLGDLYDVDLNTQLCAGGEKGEDSCRGDSGGPLVYREFSGEPWNQVGLVSYGTPECGKGVPAVYTKIESYLDWIESNMIA